MLKAGLSGGIGSGKTTVAKVFRTLGIPVFYADRVVKELYNTHNGLRNAMTKLFGSSIYVDGQLQTKALAARIFQDQQLLQQVNALTHPLAEAAFNNWVEQQDAPYVMHEAAILFESGIAANMDITISITAPEALRIQRVMQRDLCTEEQVKQRMAAQWSDEQRNAKAGFVIINDEEKALLPQVIAIHEKILNRI